MQTQTDADSRASRASPASYAQLLRVRGVPQLITSALLARTASQMWEVAIVLLALQQFHSPTLAGLSVFLLTFPGIALSPISGALLDRHGRRLLMRLDYGVAATCLLAIALLNLEGSLSPGLLLVLLTVGSMTTLLSIAGARSLFPLIVPNHLWDRANAADAVCYSAAQVAGPALAGGITAAAGAGTAMFVAAGAFVVAGFALYGVREPHVASVSRGVLRDARDGLSYVVRNRSLRWLGIASSLANVGFGIVIVALPVVVFRLHGSAAVVGAMLAIMGAFSLPATLLAGRVQSEGRERQMMAVGNTVYGAVFLVLLSPSLLLIGGGMAVAGIADAPVNVALYSLRQRRTHREWFGRAFAISASLNFAGLPIGSAIAGPLLAASTNLTIMAATVLSWIAALLILARIPAAAALDDR